MTTMSQATSKARVEARSRRSRDLMTNFVISLATNLIAAPLTTHLAAIFNYLRTLRKHLQYDGRAYSEAMNAIEYIDELTLRLDQFIRRSLGEAAKIDREPLNLQSLVDSGREVSRLFELERGSWLRPTRV